MFESARLKLTAWYLLIIMVISISFSLVIYRGVQEDLARRFGRIGMRLQQPSPPPTPPERAPLAEDLASATRGVLFMLVYANAVILFVAAGAGYMLAGKTLRPIEVALDEQKRFIGDASHELRTPLAALRTSIEVALREKKLPAREAREVLEDNLRDVENLQRLADALLTIERHGRGSRSVAVSRFDISDAVGAAVSRVEPLAQQKDVRIERHLQDSVLEADEAATVELLVILLDNAVKYTKPGGTVTIGSEAAKKHITLTVSDTGVGIHRTHLPQIFDRFYQADASRRARSAGGYGLGLAVAKEIVDAHGGSIKVSSTPDEGSTFTVLLPVGRR